MRILFLNTSFPPQVRSASRLYYDLGAYLVRSGHQVDVVTEMPWRRLGSRQNDEIPSHEIMDGMRVVRVSAFNFGETSMIGRGINLSALPFKFYRAARSLGPHDAVLIYSPPLSLGITGWMLQSLHDTPFVLNVQDIYPQTVIDLGYMKNPALVKLFEGLEQFVYRRASRIVLHSPGNVKYLLARKQTDAAKTLCLPNWIDTEAIQPVSRNNDFRKKYGIGDRFLVCYAGTMGYAQDLTALIEAAAILREQKNIQFLLVGEGVRRQEFERQAVGLENVRFLSLLRESDYRQLVSACDLGFVSLTEKLTTPVVPAKLLDFMAAARPVIAAMNRRSDTVGIIADADCGYTFSPGDSAAIANSILYLGEHPDRAAKLGAGGRQYAEQHFSLQACAQSFERIFEQIAKSSQAAVSGSPVPVESETYS